MTIVKGIPDLALIIGGVTLTGLVYIMFFKKPSYTAYEGISVSSIFKDVQDMINNIFAKVGVDAQDFPLEGGTLNVPSGGSISGLHNQRHININRNSGTGDIIQRNVQTS